ncbi:ATP-binding protein [Plasticicumulans acidivorans]|uniref:Oxygen sensor histidine kinase NreB n=1 Tax=Plasticicumulans acidivorans TaxID=886464 RepID=A0A317MYY3_9GAMM|nr:ATP-binding protein [Plasticicumulans acidivorans]PWV64880.1 glucose-6-phosphate specific signal transduction histidine kinase [Plasticicumulans acidivorans]
MPVRGWLARLSLRARLSASLAALTLCALGGALLIAVDNTREAVRAELDSSAGLALALIDDWSAQALSAPLNHIERLRALGRHRHLHIELADGPPAAPATLRPATVPAWFAHAVAAETPHFERTLQQAGGPPLTLRIYADPADELAEAWNDFHALLLLLGGFALLVNLAAWWLAGTILAPVGRLTARLDALAGGDYGAATPASGLPEFDRIGRHIDALAARLAASRADNRRLAAHALQAREEERRALAAEMHDELGQSLTAIRADAALIRRVASAPAVLDSAEAISVNAGAIQDGVRQLIRRLHPVMLDALGLRAALEQMCADWRARLPQLDLQLHWDAQLPQHPGADIHVYRIVQEGLTNIARHAAAQHACVRLHARGAQLELSIEDDGCGFELQPCSAGFGLLGLRERIESLGGELCIDTAPGAGTRLRARLPLAG